jgi:galactose-1-phosphate uridylyltransferase
MSADPAQIFAIDDLDEHEREALVSAAAWYAKYHERMIAELADDPSALAVTRREHFQALHDGLRKLGVRLRPPAGIRVRT